MAKLCLEYKRIGFLSGRGINASAFIIAKEQMDNQKNSDNQIPVIIMAGGLGTRAQSIDSSVPKPLIKINGKPVLQYEIECLVSQGYTNLILTVSHKKEQIIDYFKTGSDFGCHITYFEEDTPLGNAGALFKLWKSGELQNGQDFLLLNADSMFDIDFNRFVQRHIESHALATIFTHGSGHVFDSGLIVSDSDGWVEQWLTKEDKKPQWYKNNTNAGLHVVNTAALELSGIDPESVGTTDDSGKVIKVDLDRQILKPLASSVSGKKLMMAVSSPEYVKDMGTPERFEQVCADLTSGLVASRNLQKKQKAIFVDRDGTINRYIGFLRNIDDFELIPGAAEAIKLLNASPFLVIVATNQPILARGEATKEQLDLIHAKMETLLGESGAYIDALYYCPHHPHRNFPGEVKELKIDCDCRKPKPGMLLQAAADLNIDLSNSWTIGDSWRDIDAGRNAGTKTILLTGTGTETEYESKRQNHRFHIKTRDGGTQGSTLNDSQSCGHLEAKDVDTAEPMVYQPNQDHKFNSSHPETVAPDYTEPTLLSAVRMIL